MASLIIFNLVMCSIMTNHHDVTLATVETLPVRRIAQTTNQLAIK